MQQFPKVCCQDKVTFCLVRRQLSLKAVKLFRILQSKRKLSKRFKIALLETKGAILVVSKTRSS